MDFGTGAIGAVIPKLGKLLKEEYDLQKSVKGGIKFLKTELESMQAALKKVSGVPVEQLDENTRLWARAARELSYDIEDSIDTFLVRVESNKAAKENSIEDFVNRISNSLSNIKTRHKMATKIKDFKCLLNEAKERSKRYKVEIPTPPKEYVDPRLEAMYKKVTDLVGIDGAKSKLITMLNKGDKASNNNLTSVSVFGVGGLGKTTLAKAVFDELKVEFKCCAFVPVGQNPNVKTVLKDILLELDKNEHKDVHNLTRDIKQLIDLLREFLDNKRYFIVIDDIWDIEFWKIIKMALVQNNYGNRLIITTRKFDVAKEVGDVYYLEPLSSDHSKQLLYTRIFNGERNCLENEGDADLTGKILKKCGGIPLAIITMASLLVGKPRREWFKVYSSISLSRKGNSQVDTTMKILSLSYYDMPSHLKTCLLYLSVFPEDYSIPKKNLIWMWIAEGFVHKEQRVGLFELGETYFNALINRSMIQPVKDYLGHVNGCRLHDMVLELIRTLAHEENFVTVLDKEQSMLAYRNVIRRLSQQNMRIEHNPEAAKDMKDTRSFVACSCTVVRMVPFSSFKVLRVLALEMNGAQTIDLTHLRELLHLRYLRLKGTAFSELPKGIGQLKFLQTLDVGGTRIKELPSTISKLRQLACLRVYFNTVVGGVIGKLTSLEEVDLVDPYGQHEPDNLFCEELGNLRELRVLRCGFVNLDNSGQEALLDSLRNMGKLRHLEIYVPSVSSDGMMSINAPPKVEQVSRWHAPGAVLPRHIGVLLLDGLQFSSLPTCINSSVLPMLSWLHLVVFFIDYRDMRIFGKFPELCRLTLTLPRSMRFLVVYEGDGYFPKLRSFQIFTDVIVFFRGCKFGIPVMPSLEELHFGCSADELDDYCIYSCQNVSWLLLMMGWHHLPSLKNVRCGITAYHYSLLQLQLQETEESLRHAANSHSNRPTTNYFTNRQDKLFKLDSRSLWVIRKILDWPVHVWMFRDIGVCFDFTKLGLLEKVMARVYCHYAMPREVLQVEAALRRAVDVHPNDVILEMERYGEDEMDVLFAEQNEQPAHDDATKQEEENIAAATTATAGEAAAEEEVVYYDT